MVFSQSPSLCAACTSSRRRDFPCFSSSTSDFSSLTCSSFAWYRYSASDTCPSRSCICRDSASFCAFRLLCAEAEETVLTSRTAAAALTATRISGPRFTYQDLPAIRRNRDSFFGEDGTAGDTVTGSSQEAVFSKAGTSGAADGS